MISILRFPRRRYTPPSNTALFIPGKSQVSIGRSPNLIARNSASPKTVWSGLRATLSDETTPTPPVNAKCLKILSNDGAGAGESFANQTIANIANYYGITATLLAHLNAASGNALESAIAIGGVTTYSANVTKDDTWQTRTVTKRFPTSGSQTVYLVSKRTSTANTTDILYVDVPDLYVPQIVLPNGQIVYSDQSGIGSNGLLTFDGIDDLVILMQASQWDGTGAFSFMGWITPTGWGGGGLGHILSNGKLIFSIVNAKLQVTSDGSTTVSSAASSLSLNVKQWVGLTIAADGTANFYTAVNGLPTLSGSANQASGTPVAGGNLIGGNRVAGDRGFAGNPFDNSVLMLRIATMAEMTQHIAGTRY